MGLSRTHLAKSSGGTLIGPMMIGLLILFVLAFGKQAILVCIYSSILLSKSDWKWLIKKNVWHAVRYNKLNMRDEIWAKGR